MTEARAKWDHDRVAERIRAVGERALPGMLAIVRLRGHPDAVKLAHGKR